MGLENLTAKLETYKEAILRNRIFVIIMGILVGILLCIYAYTSPTIFVAHASFHPETSSNNTPSLSGSPLSFLLGSGGLNGDEAGMMEEVLVSRNLSEAVVRDTIEYEGQKHLLADLVMEKFPKSYSPIVLIKRLFSAQVTPSYKGKIIRAGQYVKSGLSIEKMESGFLNMDLSFYDVQLTEIIGKKYIDKLSDYYSDQKTEKSRINLTFFSQRADSVKTELDAAARSLARFQDQNRGVVFSGRMLSAKELEVKLEYLKEMYITLVTNREQAASQLQRATPIIQVLDQPLPPFAIVQKNPILFLFIGLILGLIFGAFWSTRKIIWEDVLGYIKESLEENPDKLEEA